MEMPGNETKIAESRQGRLSWALRGKLPSWLIMRRIGGD